MKTFLSYNISLILIKIVLIAVFYIIKDTFNSDLNNLDRIMIVVKEIIRIIENN